MKKILILSAILTVILCMYLYAKNNSIDKAEKPEGTFAQERRYTS